MKTSTTLLALSAVLALPVFADDARVAGYTSQLRTVRVTEIARETAKLVSEKADASDAVTAAVTVNGPSAPLVVRHCVHGLAGKVRPVDLPLSPVGVRGQNERALEGADENDDTAG